MFKHFKNLLIAFLLLSCTCNSSANMNEIQDINDIKNIKGITDTAATSSNKIHTDSPTNRQTSSENKALNKPIIEENLSIVKRKALLLEVKGPIGPATQDFIERGINSAESSGATLVILRLDTPGGLDSSMRGINRAILSAKIPVVTYVAPAGARAASAGTFILYASPIAAMAEGTNIGAASPVQIGGMGELPEINTPDEAGKKSSDKVKQEKTEGKIERSSTLEKKATHDAAAYIRSLAEIHNRNAVWGERAVREAVSLSAEEAYQLKVIDLIAADVPELLKKIDGRTVKLQSGVQKLETSNMEINIQEPDWRYRILNIITDPSIAYILLLIGFYGLFFEFSNPGFVLPGVAGSIAIILALYAFQMLPINFAGFALLLLGLAFMIAEVFISSFGVLGIGGLIAFIVGSIFLLDTQSPNYHIAWEIIALMSFITGLFFLVIITLTVRSQRKSTVTGNSALFGSTALVLSINASNSEVMVRVLGEIWSAKLMNPSEEKKVKVGDTVKVLGREGLLLKVTLVTPENVS